MAIGGSMKGHSSSGNRGRPYGLMLLLAFGAAIFGVMALHKLRERRIFNLLVKEKDRELFSLQLLLQKEREYNKEAKQKTEEMKAKLYSLRTQKTELHGRISEMQLTISSLKDEQRTVESALEEKQNEIKLLQEKQMETNKENPQLITLTESLKQKEAEIEDLKHRLEYPVKVWSVSTDDPSNSAVNLTRHKASRMKEVSGGLQESTGLKELENSSRGADEILNESTTYRDGDNSTGGEQRREDGLGFADTRETTGEHSQKQENSREEVIRDGSNGGERSIDEEGLGIKEEKNNANAAETIVNQGSEAMDGQEHGITGIGQMENPGDEGEQVEMNSKGGMKLEMADNSEAGGGYRVRGKPSYTSNPKGKRWRIVARNRRHGSIMNAKYNEDVSISRRFHKDALQRERYKKLRDDELEKLDRNRGDHNVGLKMNDESGQGNGKLEVYGNHRQGESLEVKIDDQVGLEKAGISADVDSEKPRNSEDEENESIKVGNTQINQQIEKGGEMDFPHENSDKPNRTSDDMPTYKTVDVEANGTAIDASKQKPEELEQSAENAGGVQQQMETRDVDEKEDHNSEEAKVAAEKHEEPEDLEVADTDQEAETDYRDSRHKLEEDKEERGEETEEPEF